MIVPLVGPASILGAVALVRLRAPRPFEADDELLLRGLADGAALALERARLAARERAALEQRRRGDLRLEAVLENAPDPVSRFDRQLRHTYLNLAAGRAAGLLPTAGVLGRSRRELGLGDPSLEAWETRHPGRLRVRLGAHDRAGPGRADWPTALPGQAAAEPGPDGRIESVLEVAREEPVSAAPDPAEPSRQLRDRDGGQSSAFDRILAEEQRRLVTATQLLATLTPRERDVLRLLADGRSNKEIGRALGVSAGTAKNHVSNLLLKLGVEDRVQAAVRAVEAGIVRRPGEPPAEANRLWPELIG